MAERENTTAPEAGQIRSAFLRKLVMRVPALSLPLKGVRMLLTKGPRKTWNRVRRKLRERKELAAVRNTPLYTEEALEHQKQVGFPQNVLFSVVVPLYNTPSAFLREMIGSVQAQTYAGWELCLADGSDEAHAEIGAICREYAKADSRIRYCRLEKNLGISGNTNAALDIARGDYVALLDHDDLLHPAALYETITAICEQGADFLYTDETTFHATPDDAYLPHFKPDFAPDNLRSCNYICHLSVFKRSLLAETGGFDPACDGSQDHDLMLRLTEKAGKVVHIPKILYYWRAHAGSVAQSIGVKPYVTEAGVRAVQKQLTRLHLPGTVVPVFPGHTVYRIRYELTEKPLVSVLITGGATPQHTEACIRSVFEKTTYPNYEVIVLTQGAAPEDTARFDILKREHPNLRVETVDATMDRSAVYNSGAGFCRGTYLLLLSGDARVTTPEWIEELLMFVQRSEVGAAGALLLDEKGTVRHAGLCIGTDGAVGRLFYGVDGEDHGYMARLLFAQNLSAVSGECVLVKRTVWEAIGGMDEALEAPYSDADLCLKLRRAGYLVVWTPFAKLTLAAKRKHNQRFVSALQEKELFLARWAKELSAGDPYLNPQLVRMPGGFPIR